MERKNRAKMAFGERMANRYAGVIKGKGVHGTQDEGTPQCVSGVGSNDPRFRNHRTRSCGKHPLSNERGNLSPKSDTPSESDLQEERHNTDLSGKSSPAPSVQGVFLLGWPECRGHDRPATLAAL